LSFGLRNETKILFRAKIRPNDIPSENRRSVPRRGRGYNGRLLLQRQLSRLTKSFFDSRVHGPAKFGASPKKEFFNGI
jgi:hypothetical protein